ncbi:DNA repair protein RecO [Dichotomicrobium thermohalophilum]|uniref:DNA repair protein RecO n=1 Tax=Dichotomicrobium thermohalophilum TaxID=933063 RepID=A0A397PHV1_9HYPH|nr:DNA repair protein RecO [Dichotomicrobium thermohalophilum]RIA47459.1 DNA replication and repair protein RecO [Dichotomicrobium thermohalophilum]
MQWTDEGIVLSVRPHGETAAIAELLTREHGRHLGLVHGGRSRRLRPVLQPGNAVRALWRARLPDQLGAMTVEAETSYAAQAMSDRLALLALSSACYLARLLPERDPHPEVYESLRELMAALPERNLWPALLVTWELALIGELGFGLDLGRCAATGARAELRYISPKSGRAVSAGAGAPYHDKLLPLPPFLAGDDKAPSDADICDGLRLTSYFLEKWVLAPNEMRLPDERIRLLRQLEKAASPAQG